MNKFFKWFLIGIVILFVVAFGSLQVMKFQTKKHSPEETITYTDNGYDVEITFSRPFKKGRDIFGGLVPYGQVWRTGANEPTTFVTATDLVIQGQKLPAGKYTLWTIPKPTEWEIIFNSGHPGWGVDWDEKAARQPELDVVTATVRPMRNFMVYEQLTIEFERDPLNLMLAWDFTRVDLTLEKSNGNSQDTKIE
ncbi:DUF2911 domain-containing protein [Cryomorpha ignava]|uniref:DUF2911 domain-containing protein n=1 Tax=Cryomorpha ignava TaxID=101383 RepID=A0A7K3WS80_9FLAO|nr:DUF2911 domain-containing protein [Cryomorpha ignava]NEN23712.1 DUF2911 domain-containing protein [Cryomorpha ignava]